MLAVSVALVLPLAACSPDGVSRERVSEGVSVIGGPGRTPGRFKAPRGLSAMAGRLAVVDRSGRIQTFRTDAGASPEIDRVFTISEAKLGFPLGVLLLPEGTLALVDSHYSRVRFFDRSLIELASVGEAGDGEGRFQTPQRAARDAAGRLYVTEYGAEGHNRIQVFEPDPTPGGSRWIFAGEFGSYGEDGGGFSRPMGIVVVGDEVFVSDVSHRIVVYGTDLVFRREWGREGSAQGELRYPYGIAAHEGTLFVAEYGNHRIQRFTTAGESRGSFGKLGSRPGELRNPWDVAVDEHGILFVADTGNDRVVRVDPSIVAWQESWQE